MQKMKHKKSITFKIIFAIMFVAILGICLVACDNPPPRQVVYAQQTQQPAFNWSMTDDGFVRYRWLSAGSCVVNFAGFQYTIPRNQYKGNVGPLSWKWENDGDIDIKANGRKYDLDSQFDPDDGGEAYGYNVDGYGYGDEYYDDDGFGYEEAAGGAIPGAGGYKLFHRQKKAKVFSYDAHGNPLDKRGRVISPYDKKGKPIKLVDSKGNPLPVNNTKLSKTWRPATAPGMVSGTITSTTSGKTPAQLAVENEKLKKEAAVRDAKLQRQKNELERQQNANREKKQRLKKQTRNKSRSKRK
jgi:hypothetical protein